MSDSSRSSAEPMPETSEPLAVLHDAVLAAGRAADVDAALRVLARGLATLFDARTSIAVRDDGLAAVRTVHALPDDAGDVDAPAPVTGAVWRRWLRVLDARRARLLAPGATGRVYALDLADPWVRDEFGAALYGQAAAGAAGGLLLAPVTARDGAVLATLVQQVPNAWPPAPHLVRAVEIVAQQVAHVATEERLAAVGAQASERLHRLQEAGAALARSLDETEIVRELARQVGRLVSADGVVVAHPDLERGTVRTSLRVVRGRSRALAEQPLGAGPIAEAARTGRTVRVDRYDAARTPLAAADDVVGDAGPAGSVLAAPMRVGTSLVGVVAVFHADVRAYRAEDEELLRAVAAQAGTAIANARLFAESDGERRQSEALVEVARAVGGSLRFGEVMRLILRHTSALLHAGGACVALHREDYLNVVAGVGSASLLSGVHVPVAGSMLGRALREGRHFISNDVSRDASFYVAMQRVAPMRNVVIVPLTVASGPIGVIVAMNRDADFTDADARVLQRLADHVAVAIVNARLFEAVETATREWKVAFDAVAAGLVVLDERGVVRRCNQRAADLAGVAGPKDLLGRHFREAMGLAPRLPSFDGPAWDVIARAVALGDVQRDTVRASGRAMWLEVLAAPHPDGGAVVTFDDVTAERERAAALARSEARYERLVESASDAIFTVDTDGRFTSVNHATERGTGRRRAELLGMSYEEIVEGDDSRDTVRTTLAATVGGESVRCELRFRRLDGAVRTGSLVAAPIVEDGVVVGALGVLRDVTDERRLADQLVQREKLATVGRLVRGIAHELNNPLTSVLALADLLVGDDTGAPLDSADVRDAALAIRAEAGRVARIVGKLHAFAKQRAPERVRTDVNRAALDALELRRYALRMHEVDIALDLDYEIPATWADPTQLQQVFLQILTAAEHALDAVPTGERRLTVRTRRRGERIEVAFVDTGAGYSADAAARLLEPFGSLAQDDAELAVSIELVRAHGGDVRVESAPGAGATVAVSIPFVPPPDAESLGTGEDA